MQEKRSHAGEQHPEEWRKDLNPNANAGQNYGDSEEQNAPTAHESGELRRMLSDFTKDELKRILVLPPGSRLEQGATYIDLAAPNRNEFTAEGNIEAGPDNYFVPKSQVDYQIWNRLIGITTPERIGEAD